MSLCAIAFVFSQPIVWIPYIEFLHQTIALGLGEDGGTGNA